MKLRRVWVLFVCALAAPVSSNAVIVGSLDWRQPVETIGVTYNLMATRCDVGTGACSGTLGLIDLNGWTWANRAQVHAMFEELIYPATTQFATDLTTFNQVDSAGIDAAIGAPNFLPTRQPGTLEEVNGITRTSNGALVWSPYLSDVFAAGSNDNAVLNATRGVSIPSAISGAWLYRTTPVPLPAAAWLLLSGLGGIAALARRRKSAM